MSSQNLQKIIRNDVTILLGDINHGPTRISIRNQKFMINDTKQIEFFNSWTFPLSKFEKKLEAKAAKFKAKTQCKTCYQNLFESALFDQFVLSSRRLPFDHLGFQDTIHSISMYFCTSTQTNFVATVKND